jgi:hypothetical protein
LVPTAASRRKVSVSRRPNEVLYPVDPVALEHEAGVETETAVPAEAYAGFAKPSETPLRDEFLPD